VTPNAMFSGSGLLDHFLGHCACQPGLGSVLTDLFSEYGSNFQIQRLPDLGGKTYGKVRRGFSGATICGVFKKRYEVESGQEEHMSRVVFSPKDDYVLSPRDKLIFLAPTADSIQPVLTDGMDFARPLAKEPALGGELLNALPQKIVVISDKRDPTSCVKAVCEFAPPGSEVSILSPREAKPHLRDIRRSGQQVTAHEGSIYDDDAMRKAGVHHCDTIIIVGGASYQDREMDTMLVNCLTRLRSLRAAANKELADPVPLRVVSCVTRTQTCLAATDIARRSTAAGHPMNVELITTSQLSGGYMTQVAQDHSIRLVLRHLVMDPRGHEVYIRPMHRFPKLIKQMETMKRGMRYPELADYLRSLNETVIGYVLADGTHELNPSNPWMRLGVKDSLITISEDYLPANIKLQQQEEEQR